MVTFDYTKTPITQIADYIIMYAAKSGASDIHFDPREKGLMVRIRIDGDLQDYTLIPPDYERNLITRLKLLANMNITESRLPQDGSIKGTFGKIDLDMRVSSLPTNEGEKVVIRILDYSRSLEGLEHLGFSKQNLERIKRMILEPNGIILVTGATGTGKSTTTYSILQELNKKESNIITVEDPIEMNIEGLNQVQVNSEIGLDFAVVLRSILRQDPNIILIGEIRDSETAKIAVRASITGHLVLSTIHTNNSLSTIERLLDMDVERYLLSSALTGIISQRLAKRLCQKCMKEKEATPYEKKIFKKILGKEINTLPVANENGCDDCHKGYNGRIAVHEVLEIDDEIRDALNNTSIKKENLRDLVYTSNVTTLLQDGLNKVLSKQTSFDEIYRIIEIDLDVAEDYTKPANQEEQNETAANIEQSDHIENNLSKVTNSKETASEVTREKPQSVINPKPEEKEEPIIIHPPTIEVNLQTDQQKIDEGEKENLNPTEPQIVEVPMGQMPTNHEPINQNDTFNQFYMPVNMTSIEEESPSSHENQPMSYDHLPNEENTVDHSLPILENNDQEIKQEDTQNINQEEENPPMNQELESNQEIVPQEPQIIYSDLASNEPNIDKNMN